MPRTFVASLTPFLVALLFLNACSTAGSRSTQAGRYIVSVPKASFYKYGPAQSVGPDFQLPKGQTLTVLQHSFGFSHVLTDDGTDGYVANDEIKPAPPQPTAAAPQNPFPTSPSKGGKSHRNNGGDPSPGLDMNDVPLPSTDPAPSPNEPKFRY